MAIASGGYDVELVAEPDAMSYKCSICHLVLCSPCETICCTNFLCLPCLNNYERRKGVNASCPLCRGNLEYRRAPAQERQVNQLKVYCDNREKGCEWIGELGDLSSHLNKAPHVNAFKVGCVYVQIKCPHCNKRFERHKLNQHKLECPYEEVACEYESNGCKWRGQRKLMNNHLTAELNEHLHMLYQDCQSTKNDVIPKALKTTTDKLQEYFWDSLMAATHGYKQSIKQLKADNKMLKQKIANSEVSIQSLKENHSRSVRQLKVKLYFISAIVVVIAAVLFVFLPSYNTTPPSSEPCSECPTIQPKCKTCPPYSFSICGYEDYVVKRKVWISEPFYSSPSGFKFDLKVYPSGNGIGKGSHLSFFIRVSKDNKNPFIGRIFVFFTHNNGKNLLYKLDSNGTYTNFGQANAMKLSEVRSNLMSSDCIYLGILNITVKNY